MQIIIDFAGLQNMPEFAVAAADPEKRGCAVAA
jgi:hypothetical protein